MKLADRIAVDFAPEFRERVVHSLLVDAANIDYRDVLYWAYYHPDPPPTREEARLMVEKALPNSPVSAEPEA